MSDARELLRRWLSNEYGPLLPQETRAFLAAPVPAPPAEPRPPREPTDAMLDAGYKFVGINGDTTLSDAWRAMYDAAPAAEPARNTDCICAGNWRSLVKRYEPLFGSLYRDREDRIYSLYGLVWAEDDFYFLLLGDGPDESVLSSCVGSLELAGYTLIHATAPTPEPPSAEPVAQQPPPVQECPTSMNNGQTGSVDAQQNVHLYRSKLIYL